MLNKIKTFFSRSQKKNTGVVFKEFELKSSAVSPPSPRAGLWAGDKFFGGFGATQLYTLDYWTLRARSAQLFRDNIYARGIIRRLVTNEINIGLNLESTPDAEILGMTDDEASAWSDISERFFNIWSENPQVCDFEERRNFAELQRQARLESLVSGDVLIVMNQSKITNLPSIRLINGANVQTPGNREFKNGVTCDYGVERDVRKRHLAYWVVDSENKSVRIPAFGPRSKRRIAWLVYGSDKRMDDVRGEPLLSLILQSLKEVDRYRDSAQRKAVINSILAMFIEKTQDKMGTMPITGGAIRKRTAVPEDTTNPARNYKILDQIPGLAIEELQQGEKPVPYPTTGTDVNFGKFEEAMICAVAWALEIPPEVLRLSYSSNYSASQAANNDYAMYIKMTRSKFGFDMPQKIYVEWLISSVLKKDISASRLWESWRDPKKYLIFGAWTDADWSGAIKPAVDPVKLSKAYKIMVDNGWITNERVSRELTGSKFRKNVKRIKKENELKQDAGIQIEIEELIIDNNDMVNDDNMEILKNVSG